LAVTRWTLVCAWLGLAALGSAVESALIGLGTDAAGSSPSTPVGVWALVLWLALVAPGATVAVALLVKPGPAGVVEGARNKAVIATGLALSALVACVAALGWVLMGNLDSAHLIESGRPASVWLEPGVYQVNQDPANGGFNTGPGELSFFSVTGASGPVEVTTFLSILPDDVGGLFVGAGRNGYYFAPEGRFRITRAGEYRLVNDDDSIYPAILVTAPYGVVAMRTLPWIAGSQAAFWVLLGRLAFARGKLKRRAAGSLPRGPGYAFT
jgi:hypothetical protein